VSRVQLRWLLDIEGVRAAMAGVLGGVAMGLYEIASASSVGPGLLAPLELIATPHPFARAHPVLIGLAIHLVTAGFWGTRLGIIAAVAPRRLLHGVGGTLAGLVWGAGVWVVMGKIVGPLINPVIAGAPEPHFFVGHLVYGVVSVLALGALTRRLPRAYETRSTRVRNAPASRSTVEQPSASEAKTSASAAAR
jgi:hypothetical protein